MSFDLIVEASALPDDLKGKWESLYRREGFEVEISPGFEPGTWDGGFLPMRVAQAPAHLIGIELPSEAGSGFEVAFEQGSATFGFQLGGPTTEFAVLCVGAALLAELADGVCFNPQSGEQFQGQQAIEPAKQEIVAFLTEAGERERTHHPFPGWTALQ